MRILVFMSDNRRLSESIESADYNSLVAAINYEYCKRHGYDFVYYRPYRTDKTNNDINNCLDPHSYAPRHASWSKILSTSHAISNGPTYDYVVYIDSDCIFKDFSKSLEEYIKPYESYDIIVTDDRPSNYDKPCSGFYICKVNAYTAQFAKEWYGVNMPDKNTNRLWEQSALVEIFKSYNLVLVDNDDYFFEKEGQFLRHICASCGDRTPYFRSFLKKKKIHYETTISQIPQIEFDSVIYMKSLYAVDWILNLFLLLCVGLIAILFFSVILPYLPRVISSYDRFFSGLFSRGR